MQNRKLFVTACARSGTTYMTEVLRAAGLQVGHGYVDVDGTVSYMFAATNLRYPEVPHREPAGRIVHVGEKRSDFTFEHTWHQTCDPLKAIETISSFGMPFHELLPALGIRTPVGAPQLALASRYWVGWNLLCEGLAEWRYRVEDVEELFPEMCTLLGLPEQPTPQISKTTNFDYTRPHRVITYADIRAADREYGPKVEEMAARYGYR